MGFFYFLSLISRWVTLRRGANGGCLRGMVLRGRPSPRDGGQRGGSVASSASGLPRHGGQPPAEVGTPLRERGPSRPRSLTGRSPAAPRRRSARTHQPRRAISAGEPLARRASPRAAGAAIRVTGKRDATALGTRGGASGRPQEAGGWLVGSRAATRTPRGDWLGQGGARSRASALAAGRG